jgi:inosine-uridine nucleoside N-ribohydrolase
VKAATPVKRGICIFAIVAGAAWLPAYASPREAASAPAVLFDTDVDFDDTVALAALAQQHIDGMIDLRAVTITNNGGGLPGKAYQHARCLLDMLGLDQVPVADATYDLPHAFPDTLRYAVDAILDRAVPDCAAGHIRPLTSAGELLADALAAKSGRTILIATGPLTNVAHALDMLNSRYGRQAAAHIDRAYIQGGAVRVAGGLEGVSGFDGTQALNTWADPAAARDVFAALRPGSLHLIPQDATNFVPVRLEYLAGIAAAAQTPAASYVASLMNDPVIVWAVDAGLAVYWWDPLATLAATMHNLVDYESTRIEVIQDGLSSGRTIESRTGVRMKVAFNADTALFEQTLIGVLNGKARQAMR